MADDNMLRSVRAAAGSTPSKCGRDKDSSRANMVLGNRAESTDAARSEVGASFRSEVASRERPAPSDSKT